MAATFLHQRKDFKNLLLTLEGERNILAPLIEKDYWIMHVLQSLKNAGLIFELKEGHRFPKDIKSLTVFLIQSKSLSKVTPLDNV
jgi:hypothetical protein